MLFEHPVELRQIAEDVGRKIKDDYRLPLDPRAKEQALEIRPKVHEIVEGFFRAVVDDTQFP